jgi:putative component of membrane protein insertase Oxa1/YidC/SpoIIIJ protein YidD
MRITFTIILFLLLIYPNVRLIGQTISPQSFSQTFYKKTEQKNWSFAKNNSNELEIVFSGLFLFYKFAFSSQDANKCTFHPSCSEYGLLAVKKHGTAIGILSTLDRLQRCNGLSPELYLFDQERLLLVDHP